MLVAVYSAHWQGMQTEQRMPVCINRALCLCDHATRTGSYLLDEQGDAKVLVLLFSAPIIPPLSESLEKEKSVFGVSSNLFVFGVSLG